MMSTTEQSARFEKFVIVTVPDDRRHCHRIHNAFTDGTTKDSGFGFETYDEAADWIWERRS